MRNILFSFCLLASLWTPFSLGSLIAKPPVIFPVELTWRKGAPDGFERDMIFTNGQFPGPLLSLEIGDNVEFIVKNSLPFGTTVHFHGIEMINTPWSDGVPGLSQKLIQPGQTFVYKWKATQYGTYWYHAHSKGQLEDGLFGPIYIKPAKEDTAPLEEISNSTKSTIQLENAIQNPEVVVLSDWSHFTSEQLRDISLAADIDPLCGDSILLNGQGQVNCPGVDFLMSLVPPPVLPLLAGLNLTDKGCLSVYDPIAQTGYPHNYGLVPPGVFQGCNATENRPEIITVNAYDGWASLNFISTATLQEMVVSIDEHPMWVYEIDGRYIEPQLVDAMTITHGSRHSVFVQLNKPAKDYTIRVAGDGLNQKIFGSGLLRYAFGSQKTDPQPYINYAGASTSANVTLLNDRTVVPYPNVVPAPTADQTHKLLLNRTGAAWQWSLNDNMPFNESLESIEPLLWNPNQLPDLTITTKNNTWVDLIFIVTNVGGGLQPPHPIHKHSVKGHIIGYGSGDFTWPDVASAIKDIPSAFNLVNPPLRDSFYTLPVLSEATWMAVRYHVVNPGAFLMHCHINPHLTGGMAIAILDGIDAWPTVPPSYGPGGNGC